MTKEGMSIEKEGKLNFFDLNSGKLLLSYKKFNKRNELFLCLL